MNNPNSYYKFSAVQKNFTTKTLNEYIHLIKWNKTGDELIMDIGCGSGHITKETLLPLLPKNIEKLIGVDISEEMVEYSRKHFAHENIEYDKLDIATEKLPYHYKGKFHHIFSFFCIQWESNQRQVMTNIFDLLQPGGDMFVIALGTHPHYQVFLNMTKMDKWKDHLLNSEKYVSPFHNVENVENVLNSLLKSVGFEVLLCECRPTIAESKDLKTMESEFTVVNPILKQLPENLKKEYINDYMKELQTYLAKSNKNLNGKISIPCALIIICARKPL